MEMRSVLWPLLCLQAVVVLSTSAQERDLGEAVVADNKVEELSEPVPCPDRCSDIHGDEVSKIMRITFARRHLLATVARIRVTMSTSAFVLSVQLLFFPTSTE